jgi:hypothetical protein
VGSENPEPYELSLTLRPDEIRLPSRYDDSEGELVRPVHWRGQAKGVFRKYEYDTYWFVAEPGKQYVAELTDMDDGASGYLEVSARDIDMTNGGYGAWSFTARPERVHFIRVHGDRGSAYRLVVREKIVPAPARERVVVDAPAAPDDEDELLDTPYWDPMSGWLDDEDYEFENDWDDIEEEPDVWSGEDELSEVWADDESDWDEVEE